MLDIDKWQEIFATIKKNKLRTFLTMFGVFWGIFMLMILMGSGNGLENGVTNEFKGWASNGGFIWSNRTTMPYKGLQPGRFIRFTNDDRQEIISKVEGLEYLAPRNTLGNWNSGNNISHGDKAGSFRVFGDYPEYQQVQIVEMVAGRHINEPDMKDRRKVAVIGSYVKNVLYEKDEDPIGNDLKINGIYFQVVGVFKSKRKSEQAERDEQTIFIPFSTFQQAFNFGNQIGWFAFTAKKGVPVSEVEVDIKKTLASKHHIHPDDFNALGSENLEEEFGQVNRLFDGIDVFVWIVGIGTLLAGVIGVSNIMLIIVKERTKEIGIRKSLGATPGSIIGLIIQEAIFITMVAGYTGLALGVLTLSGISQALETFEIETGMFANPEVNIQTAVVALFVLVICGALAGLIPATKAAKINPIEALHAE
ncbi:MAG: ABC transporter permease [Cyclobacteriaceae bacterium]|nr:ABC transporter permease [Cyclobacteriaceae bacterium]